MKWKEISKLKVGDFILFGDMDKEFQVAKISSINTREWFKINKETKEIENKGQGELIDTDGVVKILNEKEIKKFMILKTKLLTIKELEEDTKIKKRW
jgi:hypothetical protein